MVVTWDFNNGDILAFFCWEKNRGTNIRRIQNTRGAYVYRALIGNLAIAQQSLNFLARPQAAIEPIKCNRIGGELGSREGISNLIIKAPTIRAGATLQTDN